MSAPSPGSAPTTALWNTVGRACFHHAERKGDEAEGQRPGGDTRPRIAGEVFHHRVRALMGRRVRVVQRRREAGNQTPGVTVGGLCMRFAMIGLSATSTVPAAAVKATMVTKRVNSPRRSE